MFQSTIKNLARIWDEKMAEMINSYIKGVDISKYKYLRIDFGNERFGPGFGDLMWQNRLYLKIAYELGLILILPERKMQPRHNAGRIVKCKIGDYFDINRIKIHNSIVKVVENDQNLKSEDVLVLPALKRTKKVDTIYEFNKQYNYSVDLVRPKEIIDAVNRVIDDKNIQGCIHIRRGDRLKVGNKRLTPKEWDKSTCAEQIIHLLDNTNAPKIIYVMSDMLSTDVNIKKLKRCDRYKFVFIHDIPYFLKIKDENNYKAFNMELAMHESPKISYWMDKGQVEQFWLNENRDTA